MATWSSGLFAQATTDNIYDLDKDSVFQKLQSNSGQPDDIPVREFPTSIAELDKLNMDDPTDRVLFFRTAWYIVKGEHVDQALPDSLLYRMMENSNILNVLKAQLDRKFQEMDTDQFNIDITTTTEEGETTQTPGENGFKSNEVNRKRFLEAFRERVAGKSTELSDSLTLELAEHSNIIGTFLNNIEDKFKDNHIKVENLNDSLQYKNKRRITPDQNINIFGWHPYWVGSAYRSYNFELLSIISYFSYDVDPSTGGVRNADAIADWNNTEMVEMAHEKGSKVLLTVTNHGTLNNEVFFNSRPLVQQNVIDNVIQLIEAKNADGININFENIPKGYKKQFSYFVRNFAEQLRGRDDSMMVTLTLPAFDDNNAYDIPFLRQDVDLFVIMGYDFHINNGNVPAAVAPLFAEGTNEGRKDVALSVNEYLDKGVPSANLLLGLPYYGAMWQVADGNSGFVRNMTYREIREKYDGETLFYDSTVTANYYIIGDESSVDDYKVIWFDDEQSLRNKYDWIVDNKIGGLGIWALGYDNGYNELWSAIDDKFTEYNIPKTTIWPVTLIRTIRKHSNIIIICLAFILISLFVGFASSLADWKVREVLFQTKFLRLFYAGLLFLLAIVLLISLGYLPPMIILVVVGLVVGLIITMLVTNYINKVYSRRP